MAANAERTEVFDAHPEDIADAVDRALDDIGAGNVNWARRGLLVTACVGPYFLFWGENLTVEISRSGEVWVRSESAFPTIVLDGGKNARNCRRLLDAVADRLGVD